MKSDQKIDDFATFEMSGPKVVPTGFSTPPCRRKLGPKPTCREG